LCEAAAAGRVVVAPDRGGYAEVLKHQAGGLFPSRAPSAAELAACVDAILDDPRERVRMGAVAAARAEAVWSARTVAASLREAYVAVSSVTE
jgi:glycosyltransferase involved in cell wall biosynthesis